MTRADEEMLKEKIGVDEILPLKENMTGETFECFLDHDDVITTDYALVVIDRNPAVRFRKATVNNPKWVVVRKWYGRGRERYARDCLYTDLSYGGVMHLHLDWYDFDSGTLSRMRLPESMPPEEVEFRMTEFYRRNEALVNVIDN